MKISNLNKTGADRIKQTSQKLKENYNVTVKPFQSKQKLEKILENASSVLVGIRNSKKKFHLDPEYAKYLGIVDLVENMLKEGMYAESPAYESMCNEMRTMVHSLMDSGYTDDEAVSEAMNRYRMDPRWAYDDQQILPVVLTAAKDYLKKTAMTEVGLEEESVEESPLDSALAGRMIKYLGIDNKLPASQQLDEINAFIEKMAEASGKSAGSVSQFVSELDEDKFESAMSVFEKKIQEKLLNDSIKYMHSLKQKGKSVDEIAKELNMTPEEVKDAMKKTEESVEESMFDGIIDDILSEDVDMGQAEVVLAAESLADELQDHVEKVGRMINEELPAIVEKMREEMGAQTAASFQDQMTQALQAQLESSKATKEAIEAAVGTMTGQAPLSTGPDDMGAAEPESSMDDEISGIDDLDLDDEEPPVNTPASALGREELE